MSKKSNNKDILDKAKNGLNLFIIGMFIIAIIYFAISSIFNFFNQKKEESKNLVDINNIESNIITQEEAFTEDKDSNIVKDYNIFYALKSCTDNFLQYLVDGKYSETYTVLSNEFKNKYSKSDYVDKIKTFNEERIMKETEEGKTYFGNSLINAYEISDSIYICNVKDKNDKIFKIGIKLNTKNKTYKVFYIEL